MTLTVAADVDMLRRFRADVDAALPALQADSRAVREALAAVAASPGHHDPPPVPPPDLVEGVDDLVRQAHRLEASVGAAERRFALADGVGAGVRQSGTGASSGIGSTSDSWLANDLWQTLQSTTSLFRLVAPDILVGERLARVLPDIRSLLAATGRTKLLFPVAGSVLSVAFTFADLAHLIEDGNPLHAFRRDGAGYVADGTQVVVDALSGACAGAPSVPTCAGALAANTAVFELHRWHDNQLVGIPVLPGLLVPVRPAGAKRVLGRASHAGVERLGALTERAERSAAALEHDAERGIGAIDRLRRRGEDTLVRAATPTLREAGHLLHELVPDALR